MAHFAEIDENNVVLRVLVVDDLNEADGHNFLANTLGLGGTWIKTSYNTHAGEHKLGGTPFRKNYAGIGSTYDVERDAFIPPKDYPSWVLNENTCLWEAPNLPPASDKPYKWNEANLAWEEVTPPTE
jgi:hypothetical protein